MNIVLLKGRSQYDANRLFTDELAEAFQELGHKILVIDLCDKQTDLLQDFLSFSPDFSVSINAIRPPVSSEIFNELKIPHVAYCVDHPVYQIRRYRKKYNNIIWTFPDREHINFVKNSRNKKSFFLPHGSSSSRFKILKEKDIDIIFAGSVSDPNKIRNMWSVNYSKNISRLLEQMTDHLFCVKYKERPEKVVYKILNEFNIKFDKKFQEIAERVFIPELDLYARSFKRKNVLQLLNGYNLHVFGNVNIDLDSDTRITVHKPVTLKELYSLYERSKIVLNILPDYFRGSHERIFEGTLAGGVVITHASSFLSETYSDGESIVFYHSGTGEDIPKKLDYLLSHDEERKFIAMAGRNITLENHTWYHRAKELLTIVTEYKKASETNDRLSKDISNKKNLA